MERMTDDKNRDLGLRVPAPYHDVSSGYLLNKWAGLPAYDDVAALVTLATTLVNTLEQVRKQLPNSFAGEAKKTIDRALRLAGRIP